MDKILYTILILIYITIFSIVDSISSYSEHTKILQQIDSINTKLDKLEDKL